MKLAQDETGYILVGDSHPTECFAGGEEAVAAYAKANETINGFWRSVNSGAKVTCCEVVVGEYRFKVCVGMPEHIEAYMDYVDPTEAPAPVEPEMQYINRRESDGALWPTFCPITSPGWVQIGAYPIAGRHEVGDTVLIFNGYTDTAEAMTKDTVVGYLNGTVRLDVFDIPRPNVSYINFSKGDHLTPEEREAWHQEATGYQESYYSTFNQ